MKKLVQLTLVFFCFTAVTSYAQRDVTLDANKLVSDATFTKLLFDELNFLVIGDNTPSQGFSTELSDDKSELSVKGLLVTFEKSLITLDGEFSVDDGVYFFDENEGSKSSKVTLNVISPVNISWLKLRTVGSYKSAYDEAIQRTLIVNSLAKRNMIFERYTDFYVAHSLLKEAGIPVKNVDSITKKIENKMRTSLKDKIELLKKELDPNVSLSLKEAYIKKHSLRTVSSALKGQENFTIINVKKKKDGKKKKDKKKDTIINVKIKEAYLDELKLIKAYEASYAKLKIVEEELYKEELDNAKEHWNALFMPYWSISAFYQRESASVFEFKDNTPFSELFNDQFGDLYGVDVTLNFYRRNVKGWTFFLRFLGSVGNTSNLSDFSKVTINQNTTIFESETAPIVSTNDKTAYTNSLPFEYGSKSTLSNESYFMYKGVGVFGIIGHNGRYFNFSETAINDSHTYPMRLGILGNLKTKKDAKNALTFQFFIDRSDLSIDPTGSELKPIDDWRFGFKLGLPINMRANK